MTDLERSLEQEVKVWVERQFNFIQLEVITGFCQSKEQELYEYIRTQSVENVLDEWLDQTDSYEVIRRFFQAIHSIDNQDLSEYRKHEGSIKTSFVAVFGEDEWDSFVEFCSEEYEDEIQEYIYEQENYPMWNTLFEYRDTPSDEELENAIKLGMGVVEGLDPFNPMIFMMSAGHSFYSSYWIPLYLSRFADAREKYKDVNYSHL